jgi:hypothetical protein
LVVPTLFAIDTVNFSVPVSEEIAIVGEPVASVAAVYSDFAEHLQV